MKRKCWSDKDLNKLIELYPNMQSIEVAKIFNCGIHRIYNKAFSLGLKKSQAYLNSEESGRMAKGDTRGLGSRFPKGHKPFNKGLGWSEWMDEEARLKSLKTTYKKGQLPHNTKSDGEVSIRKDNNGNSYKYIRINVAEWQSLHSYNWEKENGPVPESHIVVFKTPDKMNCDISNLELITREENMRRNSYLRYPEDIRRLIQIKGALNRQINKQNDTNNPN